MSGLVDTLVQQLLLENLGQQMHMQHQLYYAIMNHEQITASLLKTLLSQTQESVEDPPPEPPQ